MQFLQMDSDMTLPELNERVGRQNVEAILTTNQLPRTHKIGEALAQKCQEVTIGSSVAANKKVAILNTMMGDADVFEYVASIGEAAWEVLQNLGTLPGYVKIPESVNIGKSVDMLGNGISMSVSIGRAVFETILKNEPIDLSLFNTYQHVKPGAINVYGDTTPNGFDAFKIPWGEITLYSSISNMMMDIPVYPETVDDSRVANYTTMPDLLYQYEPWQLYQSSGPRANSFTFKFHRDMWGWDHTKGGANRLIRFCEANCFPDYRGSAVHTSTVTLYVAGRNLITGVMTNVDTNWSGPIGHDGWYLVCEMTLSITEVSPVPLNYNYVRNMPIIGSSR